MKLLIVEDETAAYENLVDILSEIDSSIQVVGNTESIKQTIIWLQTNPVPDLILMDIHLSDGSAFSIFDSIRLETPIIFTTAYDEYAISAFKVNSIDYLLKPIKTEELRFALEKFRKWSSEDVFKYLKQLSRFAPAIKYKDKLLIPLKDKLQPVNLNRNILLFIPRKKTQGYTLRMGRIILIRNHWNKSRLR